MTDRSDMTFSTKPLRNSVFFPVICRLGGWASQLEMAASCDERFGEESGYDALCRLLGDMHDCDVEFLFLGKATQKLRFSNFVSDEEAALFRLKYL